MTLEMQSSLSSFSVKPRAFSDMLSFLRESAISCTPGRTHTANSSSSAFASFRSRVSKPSVNQP
jgi:hypothetical protein